jgi:hypothetical protein
MKKFRLYNFTTTVGFGLLIDFLCLAANTLAIKTCWNWFQPEVFPTAPTLTFTNALGLFFISACFMPGNRPWNWTLVGIILGRPVARDKTTMAYAVITPVAILVYAWVARLLFF